jgi:hypothetical protein
MAQVSTYEQGNILCDRLMSELAEKGMTRNPDGTRIGNVYQPHSLTMADGRTLIVSVSVHRREFLAKDTDDKYWTLVSYSVVPFNGPSRSMGLDGFRPSMADTAERIVKTIEQEMS